MNKLFHPDGQFRAKDGSRYDVCVSKEMALKGKAPDLIGIYFLPRMKDKISIGTNIIYTDRR